MSSDLRLKLILDTVNKATAPLKSISKQSDKTAKAIAETRKKLKSLEQTQKSIAKFKGLQKSLDETSDKLSAQREKTKRLAEQIKNTSNPTKNLIRQFENAKKASAKLKQQHKEQTAELHKTSKELKAAGLNTKNLSLQERNVARNIKRTTEAIKQQKTALSQLAQQQKRKADIDERMKKIHTAGIVVGAHGAGAMYAGQRALRGIASQLTPGIDYGEQMSAVQAVTRLNKNDLRYRMLQDQARELGSSTSYTASEVGAGQEFLARANFSPEAIKSSMKDVLYLAKANKTELGRTADIASNISSAFKIDPEAEGSMRRVSDVLTATTTRANVNLEMLGDTMKYLGQAEGLKMSLEQAAAMAGLLGNIGIQGSMAGTTMRAMLTRLSAPTGAAADAIEELGIKVADSKGNLRQIPDILLDISKATQKMGNTKRTKYLKEIFGEEPGSGMAELINQQGTKGISKFVNILKNVKGENAKVAKIMGDNIAGDIKAANSAWEEIGITLTDTNNGPIRELIKSLTDVIRNVGDWMKANPELTAKIIKWGAALAVIVTALGALGFASGGLMMMFSMFSKLGLILPILKGLVSLVPLLAGGIKALSAALLANPIALAVTAIAAGLYLLYRNWDEVKAFFSEMWVGIKKAWDGGLADIAATMVEFNPIALLIKAMKSGLNLLLSFLPDELSNWVRNLNKMFINSLKSILPSWIGDRVENIFSLEKTDIIPPPMQKMSYQPLVPAGTGPLSIENINVHPAPGMNEQDLAAKVALEVKKLQRVDRNQQRSKMRDDD